MRGTRPDSLRFLWVAAGAIGLAVLLPVLTDWKIGLEYLNRLVHPRLWNMGMTVTGAILLIAGTMCLRVRRESLYIPGLMLWTAGFGLTVLGVLVTS